MRSEIPALLTEAGPLLFTVTLNGADAGVKGPQWNRLIQTLDRGSYDVGIVLRTLEPSASRARSACRATDWRATGATTSSGRCPPGGNGLAAQPPESRRDDLRPVPRKSTR